MARVPAGARPLSRRAHGLAAVVLGACAPGRVSDPPPGVQDGVWPASFIDRTDAVTTRDAAYLAVYLRAAAAVRRLGPVRGLYAAFLGERRVPLGLD